MSTKWGLDQKTQGVFSFKICYLAYPIACAARVGDGFPHIDIQTPHSQVEGEPDVRSFQVSPLRVDLSKTLLPIHYPRLPIQLVRKSPLIHRYISL